MKAAIPHMANYSIPLSIIVDKIFGMEFLEIPNITKKTVELGSKYSPDYICSPFKFNLGNFIEALEKGADVLLQIKGSCRFGYYGELQSKILKDLGYDFEFIYLENNLGIKKLYKMCKSYNKKLTFLQFVYYMKLCIVMTKKIDIFEFYMRKNIGFEINQGTMDKIHKEFLKELKVIRSYYKLNKCFKKYYKLLKEVKLKKDDDCLKVLIIGELYTVMETNSNHHIELELAKMKVEVIRYIDLSYLIFENMQSDKKVLPIVKNIVKYPLGASATDNVSKTLTYENIDGIIHIKSSFCTPEVDATVMIQKIAGERNIPTIHFSFDTETENAGIITRIEAFYDMIKLKKGGNNI
ncbi:MAG: 2-hydroxyacyl-CoA dehydratase [Bacilli bacterium]